MNRHFFEEDIQINLAHEKTHIIISHQENANQSHNEIYTTLYPLGYCNI